MAGQGTAGAGPRENMDQTMMAIHGNENEALYAGFVLSKMGGHRRVLSGMTGHFERLSPGGHSGRRKGRSQVVRRQ